MSDLAGAIPTTTGLGALTATALGAKSGSTVQARVGAITVTVQVARDLTVAAGDVLLVLRQGSAWWAVARLFTAASAPPEEIDPEPEPAPVSTGGTLVCPPVETRSYRAGKWRTDTSDVIQGSYGSWGNNTGCAFYGSKPRSLAGATATSALLTVRRDRGGVFAAQALAMRLMPHLTRPSGAPTLGASAAGPSLAVDRSTRSFAIPTSWAQSMIDGSAGGIAVYQAGGSPYIVTAGRAAWASAWTLTITWRRDS